jgi:mannosyltransferase OCH1-like enzyme
MQAGLTIVSRRVLGGIYSAYTPHAMIPKIIHQIWIQGESELPDKYKDNVSLLKSLNPGWKHVVWDNDSLREQCARLGDDVVSCFDAAEYMHQKVDLGRYVVVYLHGGISIDMDVKALRPLDSLKGLQNISTLAVSRMPLNRFESWLHNRFTSTLPPTNNATLIAPSRNHALLHLITCVCQRIASREKGKGGKFFTVMNTTGPFAFMESLRQLPKSSYIELPAKYFEPCFGLDDACIPTYEALVLHKHDATWVNQGLQNIGRSYFVFKRNFHWIVMVVLITWLLWHYLK